MEAEEKSRYFEEVARSLQRGGFVAEAVDDEGLLPVRWQGQPLCRVTAEGSVRYTPGEIKGDAGNEAICQVANIAKITSEYMALVEAAPPLQAKGLEGGYRLLTEFNGTVLAGQPTQHGVPFATWERDFAKTGLCWGHYFEDYGKAKQDFATRSGLVAENRLFSPEQLTEIYRTVYETLDGEFPITNWASSISWAARWRRMRIPPASGSPCRRLRGTNTPSGSWTTGTNSAAPRPSNVPPGSSTT